MSQHDGVVDDASGAVVRADLNAALQAILSDNSGATAPSTTYANEWWTDTANHVRWQRNEGNSAWILRGRTDTEGLVSKSSGFTAGLRDFGKAFHCSAALTVAFTAAATLTDGWHCDFRNRGSGNVTLDPASSELIDGAATLTLYPGESCRVWCDGSAFRTVGLHPVAVGDSGSGGVRGLVPAPAAGDAAAGKFLKADMTYGVPASGALVLIDSDAPSSAATSVLTGIDGTYDGFVVIGWFRPANDGALPQLGLSTDGGTSFVSLIGSGQEFLNTNTDSGWAITSSTAVASLLPGGSNSRQVGNDADNLFALDLRAINLASASARKAVLGAMYWAGSESTGANYGGHVSIASSSTSAINALVFKFSTGNIAAGWWAVYGYKKS